MCTLTAAMRDRAEEYHICTISFADAVVSIHKRRIQLAVWQLQPKVVQTVQQRIPYAFIWIRRTYDYI